MNAGAADAVSVEERARKESPMNRATRALTYSLQAAGGLLLTGVTFLAVRSWAGMYLPAGSAAATALAAAALPGYLLNKLLTRSYSRLEYGASEWGSIFEVLLLTNGLVAGGLWMGIAGIPAQVATQEALDQTVYQLGLVDEPSERTVQAFPRARMDTGVLWVPNLGTSEQPRVIARLANGTLKVEELGPRGSAFEARSEVVRGPVSLDGGEVMLAPVPDPGTRRTIEVEWEGGVARFVLSDTLRKATFRDR